jgi:hypothetical protein
MSYKMVGINHLRFVVRRYETMLDDMRRYRTGQLKYQGPDGFI